MPHDHFCSPPDVCDLLWRFFDGPVGLDPCTNANSIVRAIQTFSAGALHLAWKPPKSRNSIYENPPFSAPYLKLFLEYGIAQRKRFGFEHIRLVPVSTSTAWWRIAYGEAATADGLVSDRPSVCFTKRLPFIDLDGTLLEDVARFDTAIFYYGHRHGRFQEIFGQSAICNRFELAPGRPRSVPARPAPEPRVPTVGRERLAVAGVFRAASNSAQRELVRLALDSGCATVNQLLWALSMPHRDRVLIERLLLVMKNCGEVEHSQRKWQPVRRPAQEGPSA